MKQPIAHVASPAGISLIIAQMAVFRCRRPLVFFIAQLIVDRILRPMFMAPLGRSSDEISGTVTGNKRLTAASYDYTMEWELVKNMSGRPITNEQELLRKGYGRADFIQRRKVLRDTLAAFSTAEPPEKYQALADTNLDRWYHMRQQGDQRGQVRVTAGDWGEVTHTLTKTYGVCFAVLNMANAYVPGGAYVEGAPAQEENMFRRTDCHFHVGDDEYDESRDRYLPDMTRLISAGDGSVYLDTDCPRTCIRGPEDRLLDDLGYPWLPDHEVFPFFELRAAAQDLRDGSDFNRDEARRRIVAQLDTLRDHGIRHVVMGAFGCGAFKNPSRDVAQIYREEISTRCDDFACIAFAIFAAGYGPDNTAPFADVFRD